MNNTPPFQTTPVEGSSGATPHLSTQLSPAGVVSPLPTKTGGKEDDDMGGDGWIRLHRVLLESKLWSSSDATFRLAIYLMLTANHRERWHRRVLINRGQLVRSITQLSDECHLSRKAVRYGLKVLAADGFLTVDEPFGAHRGHRITVCNYAAWQQREVAKGTPGARQGHTEGTAEGTPKVTQTRPEEDEEGKKEKEPPIRPPEYPPCPPLPDPPPPKPPPKRFVPPTASEVDAYAAEMGWPDFWTGKFIDTYEAKGWMIGKNKMKVWQATARNAYRDGWCKQGGKPPAPSPGLVQHTGGEPSPQMKEYIASGASQRQEGF